MGGSSSATDGAGSGRPGAAVSMVEDRWDAVSAAARGTDLTSRKAFKGDFASLLPLSRHLREWRVAAPWLGLADAQVQTIYGTIISAGE